jgi:L-iditol 2-dehydrogenase
VDLTPLVTHRFGVDRALDALAAARQPASTIKAHVELDASVGADGGARRQRPRPRVTG